MSTPRLASRPVPLGISVMALADLLGVPTPTIRGWLRRGVLRSFRIGGRRLVDRAEVERIVGHAPRTGRDEGASVRSASQRTEWSSNDDE